MILKKIKLKNFRQFYGEQEIDFARGDNNLTIVLGENGTGKTGIFRALIYALFGDRSIDQDSKNADIRFINLRALEENNGKPTDGYVEILFDHKSKEYRLRRNFKGVKMSQKINDDTTSASLYISSEAGDYNPIAIEDKREIDAHILQVIDKDTKDFFFFDGEKIESLSSSGTEVRKEVKKVITKLLKIDQLEQAIDILKYTYNEESKRITENSKNTDVESKRREIENIDKKIESTEIIIDEKRLEAQEIKKIIGEKNAKLEENAEINALISKKDEINSKINLISQNLAKSRDNLSNYLNESATSLILSDVYGETKFYLDDISKDQSSIIDYNALITSLEQGVCMLCNNDLNSDHDAHAHVEYLKNSYKNHDMSTLISSMQNNILQHGANKENRVNQVNNELQDFADIKSQLDKEKLLLEQIDNSIKEKAVKGEDLKHTQSALDKYKDEEVEISASIQRYEGELEQLKRDLSRKENEFNELLARESGLQNDQKRLQFIKELNKKLELIFDEYSSHMRHRLSEETTIIFKKLIAQKDREMVNNITINENYEININTYSDPRFTDNISQGQKEIVSLAFITALSNISARDEGYDSFPLFMDTPLGRVSGENRENILRNLPDLTSQLVLLLTDTEYTADEERVVKDTDYLGSYYELQQVREFETQIVKRDITDAIASRGL